MSLKIACFISAHGFGHAARTSAILETLMHKDLGNQVHLFTQVPAWFFQTSLSRSVSYHPYPADVGLAQKTAMLEDLPETVRRLAAFFPPDEERFDVLVAKLVDLQVDLVLCDISPLGILAAERAGVPSVLVENFTWDWIYTGYLSLEPGFQPFIEILRDLFARPAYHIQTRPFCVEYPAASLVTAPVARTPRTPRAVTREKLGIPETTCAVLVTMGGIQEQYTFIHSLPAWDDTVFIIPGASEQTHLERNLVLLPHHSEYYHPDLIHACDGVVGKVGYSTLAEAYTAGVPFGYVTRKHLRESGCLVEFIQAEMAGFEIGLDEFSDGSWTSQVKKLTGLGRRPPHQMNGADQAADFLHDLVGRP